MKPLLVSHLQTADTLSLSRPSADFLSEPVRRKPQAMKRHQLGGGRLSGLPFKRRFLNASNRLPHCRLPLLRRLPLGRACSWDLTHVTLRLELLTHPQTPGFSPHKVHLMLTLQALYCAKLSCSLKFYNAQKTRLALTLHLQISDSKYPKSALS